MLRRLLFLGGFLLFSSSFAIHEPSLREKIGQMLIMGFEGKTVTEQSEITRYITEDNIGGVILFDFNPKSQTFDKNIESQSQVHDLNNQLQLINSKANRTQGRMNVPLFISVDYEGGKVNRLHPRYGFPAIPSALDVGKGSLENAHNQAKIMTDVLKLSGFNLDYFPGLDVNVNPNNPIIGKKGRSFSDDPNKVTQFAQEYSTQFLDNQVECAYKHFPGHGSSLNDSHLGFVDISTTWTSQELIPFLQLLSLPKHCGMVMVAHVVNRNLDASGLPATLSYNVISGLLRHDLQFDGVVITDDMQMKAISDYYGLATSLTLAINAGADMLIFGNQLNDKPQDPKELIDLIAQKVHTGDISESRINDAYHHIMVMKHRSSAPPVF
jgi:beta-N-acetylhexosaminidase